MTVRKFLDNYQVAINMFWGTSKLSSYSIDVILIKKFWLFCTVTQHTSQVSGTQDVLCL